MAAGRQNGSAKKRKARQVFFIVNPAAKTVVHRLSGKSKTIIFPASVDLQFAVSSHEAEPSELARAALSWDPICATQHTTPAVTFAAGK